VIFPPLSRTASVVLGQRDYFSSSMKILGQSSKFIDYYPTTYFNSATSSNFLFPTGIILSGTSGNLVVMGSGASRVMVFPFVQPLSPPDRLYLFNGNLFDSERMQWVL
jgi:hypothetical protein